MATTSNESPENLVLDSRAALKHGPQKLSATMRSSSLSADQQQQSIDKSSLNATTLPPPVVYGELSILGYNGYIPNVERSGRRNRSKYLLCQRPAPNGIKKTKRYYVKQPQATKAIQDKDLHSISYTFSRSQTIIVEYGQDQDTDMFQIGRSSEEPIDFVVVDTFPDNLNNLSNNHQHHHLIQSNKSHHNHYNENNSSGSQMQIANDLPGMNRIHRHLAKVGDELIRYGMPLPAHDTRAQHQLHFHRNHQTVLLNYPQPNMSNLPAMMADHFRSHEQSYYHQQQMIQHHHAHSSGVYPVQSSTRETNHNQPEVYFSRQQQQISQKRSHTTQSTISRFACRIIVDRKSPFTARIYAAGFDSSKNIFLGEKATKWEQNDSIDGLTTNGVLLMHPKRGSFYSDIEDRERVSDSKLKALDSDCNIKLGDSSSDGGDIVKQFCSNNELRKSLHELSNAKSSNNNSNSEPSKWDDFSDKMEVDRTNELDHSDNIACKNSQQNPSFEYDEVWREVSVDGGIYAIRESRSAAQKGTKIDNESNILQDGTLIDLCGATLLWRSVDGFRASPTKKSLEDKVDLLNASRPQCPVGLNTLVIPRKPITPGNQHHRHGHRDHSTKPDKSHQPYVYLKCGHVQGYHDWGTTEKSNQRTCPICLSVGTVAKLSMGLEPSFYVDSGPLTHAFNPCGHMASESTVKYWCSIKIPHGTHFFHSICPFCAIPLTTNEPASTKLIFQDDLD